MAKPELRPDIQETGKEDQPEKPFKHEREELSFKEERWFYRTRIFFLGLAAFCTAAFIAAFVWHLLMPGWHWLEPDELNRIKELAVTLIVGIVMSGATTYFFKK